MIRGSTEGLINATAILCLQRVLSQSQSCVSIITSWFPWYRLGTNLGCVSLRKSKIGFLNPTESEKRILRFFTKQINARSFGSWCVKGPKNPLPEWGSHRGISVISWFYFPWLGFRKLFFVIRDLNVLREPWRIWNLYSGFWHSILSRKSFEWLESSVEGELSKRFERSLD